MDITTKTYLAAVCKSAVWCKLQLDSLLTAAREKHGGREGFHVEKVIKAILYMGIHVNIYICNYFLHLFLHVFVHVSIYMLYIYNLWTRCPQKIFTYQLSVIVPAQPLVYSHFEMSVLSSELSEGTMHPLGHTDASKSKTRQSIRELSHLQERQQTCEGTHYIQRTGV